MHLTGVRNFAEQASDERRFACTVFPDNRREFPAMQMQIDMLENRSSTNTRPDIAQRGAAFTAAVGSDAVVRQRMFGSC